MTFKKFCDLAYSGNRRKSSVFMKKSHTYQRMWKLCHMYGCMVCKCLREDWWPNLSSNSGPWHLSPGSPKEFPPQLSSSSNSPPVLLPKGSSKVHVSLTMSLVCLNPFSGPSGSLQVGFQLLKLGGQAWSWCSSNRHSSSLSCPWGPNNQPVISAHNVLPIRPFSWPFIRVASSTPPTPPHTYPVESTLYWLGSVCFSHGEGLCQIHLWISRADCCLPTFFLPPLTQL